MDVRPLVVEWGVHFILSGLFCCPRQARHACIIYTSKSLLSVKMLNPISTMFGFPSNRGIAYSDRLSRHIPNEDFSFFAPASSGAPNQALMVFFALKMKVQRQEKAEQQAQAGLQQARCLRQAQLHTPAVASAHLSLATCLCTLGAVLTFAS